LISDKEQHTDL